MKQQISIEQLKELTVEQQEHLQKLWEPQDGDWIAQISHDYVLLIEKGSLEISSKSTIKYNFLPLLTIGQMIELLSVLNQESPEDEGDNLAEDADDSASEYRISWRVDEELADRLWESVKMVL